MADLVQIRRFASNWDNPTFFGGQAGPLLSPGGGYFAVMSQRGDLSCDCNHYELAIYAAAAVKAALNKGTAAPGPLRTIKMSSTSGEQLRAMPIYRPVWENENQLLFLGTGDMGDRASVFRFDVRSGILKRLSDPDHDVIYYSVLGDRLIYVAFARQKRERDTSGRLVGFNQYPVQALRGGFAYGGLFPFVWGDDFVVDTIGIFRAVGDSGTQVVLPFRTQLAGDSEMFQPHLSPDGRWAVMLEPIEPKAVPIAWRGYKGLDIPYPQLKATEWPRIHRILLVDILAGTARALWDAPLGPAEWGVDFAWSTDSRHLVVKNAMLPLEPKLPEHASTAYLLDYDVQRQRTTILEPMERRGSSDPTGATSIGIAALPEGFRVIRRESDADGKRRTYATMYRLQSDKLVAQPASIDLPPDAEPKLPPDLRLEFREAANEPTRLVASNGKREVVLIGPDPTLKRLYWRPVKPVQWIDPDGFAGHGGLVLPMGRGPFPLVVQIQRYEDKRFQPDGSVATSMATQALAARGIAVLNMDESEIIPERTKALANSSFTQLETFVRDRIDAAIGSLATRGVIDKTRVGLVGFSSTGFSVYFAITHPGQVTPAAAIVADSTTYSYSDYALSAGIWDSNARRQNEWAWGGSFWNAAARKTWLEGSPPFNVDKVDTPALFLYSQGPNLPFVLAETVGAFRLNEREIDLMFFPSGNHQLVRPREREASLNATLEWMAFWLQGCEISPDKQDQYSYWRRLREQRNRRNSKKVRSCQVVAASSEPFSRE